MPVCMKVENLIYFLVVPNKDVSSVTEVGNFDCNAKGQNRIDDQRIFDLR